MIELYNLLKELDAHYEGMSRKSYAVGVIGKSKDAQTYQEGLAYAIKKIEWTISYQKKIDGLADVERAYWMIDDAKKMLEHVDDDRARYTIKILEAYKDAIYDIIRSEQ